MLFFRDLSSIGRVTGQILDPKLKKSTYPKMAQLSARSVVTSAKF